MPENKGNSNESDSEITREEAVARMKKRMEADARSPGGHVGYRRFRIGGFWIAFIATPVVIVAISLVGLTVAAATAGLPGTAFVIPLALLVVAVLAAVVFALSGKGDVAGGIFAGIALLIIGLGITCFAATVRL